ncbi:hypothetical protein [Natrinema soli]|uniref:DUF7978 domain-containing protein n=1 Tax=Natrinema soli TaxID=1930624 RepID=A0ABD5SPE7_9EURY|nr:hypothetical protein [Natrinema soli]
MSDGKQLDYETEESTEQQRVPRDDGSDLPIKEGAVFGAIAVVATYLTHLLLTVMTTARISPEAGMVGSGEDASYVVTDMVASWKAAGWSYLSAFGSGFEAEGESAVLSAVPNHGAAFVNGPFGLSDLFLFLVTLGGIVAAGYGIARYTETDTATEAVKTSLTVVPAYLVFAAIAAVVMTHTFTDDPAITAFIGEATGHANAAVELEVSDIVTENGYNDIEFGPSTSSAILLAGLVVPAILAAIGGVLTQPRDALETVMAKVQ